MTRWPALSLVVALSATMALATVAPSEALAQHGPPPGAYRGHPHGHVRYAPPRRVRRPARRWVRRPVRRWARRSGRYYVDTPNARHVWVVPRDARGRWVRVPTPPRVVVPAPAPQAPPQDEVWEDDGTYEGEAEPEYDDGADQPDVSVEVSPIPAQPAPEADDGVVLEPDYAPGPPQTVPEGGYDDGYDDGGADYDEPEPGVAPPASPRQPVPTSPDETREDEAPPGAMPAPDRPLSEAQTQAIATEIVRLTNEERARHGLAPVAFHVKLATAAWLHSEEMHRLRYFSHESPSPANRTMVKRIQNAGVADFGVAGENIAMTTLSRDVAAKFVKMWMDSKGHRENILSPDFSFLGVGIYGDQRYVYATQVFSKTAGSAGARTTAAVDNPF